MCSKKQNSMVLWFVNCKKKSHCVLLIEVNCFGVFQVIKGLLKLWPKTCSQKEVGKIRFQRSWSVSLFYFCRSLFQVHFLQPLYSVQLLLSCASVCPQLKWWPYHMNYLTNLYVCKWNFRWRVFKYLQG